MRILKFSTKQRVLFKRRKGRVVSCAGYSTTQTLLKTFPVIEKTLSQMFEAGMRNQESLFALCIYGTFLPHYGTLIIIGECFFDVCGVPNCNLKSLQQK